MKEADNNKTGRRNENHNIVKNNSMKQKYPGQRHQDEAHGSGEKLK
jgi:hypothetical protein